MAPKNTSDPSIPGVPGFTPLKKDYVQPPKNPEALIKDIQEGRLETLREAITDIETQISQRQRLHKEMMDDLDVIKSQMRESLPAELKQELLLAAARNPDTFKILVEVLRQQVDIDALRVKEKLDEWRDIAELKEELRERKQLLHEAEGKGGILEEILS
jgi:hypothetical protein